MLCTLHPTQNGQGIPLEAQTDTVRASDPPSSSRQKVSSVMMCRFQPRMWPSGNVHTKNNGGLIIHIFRLVSDFSCWTKKPVKKRKLMHPTNRSKTHFETVAQQTPTGPPPVPASLRWEFVCRYWAKAKKIVTKCSAAFSVSCCRNPKY